MVSRLGKVHGGFTDLTITGAVCRMVQVTA